MAAKTIGAAAVLAFLLAAPPAFPPAAAGSRTAEGRIVRVVDGDTVAVAARRGGSVSVRLYGIDAPEVRHGETPGQPYGRQARQALKELTLGRNVRVEIVDADTHGRSVGLVFRGGLNVNLAMVRGGWAWAYRRHLFAPYASEFIGAEREARAKRRGLWRDDNPTPPWEFRWRAR
ncbi:MAG: thermonuclease family protein [Gemmatimonadota bacterium]